MKVYVIYIIYSVLLNGLHDEKTKVVRHNGNERTLSVFCLCVLPSTTSCPSEETTALFGIRVANEKNRENFRLPGFSRRVRSPKKEKEREKGGDDALRVQGVWGSGVKENLPILLLKSARTARRRENFSSALENFASGAVDLRGDESVESKRSRETATSLTARIGGLLAVGLVATAVAHGRTSGSPPCVTADLAETTPKRPDCATLRDELPPLPTYEEVFQNMADCPDPEIESLTFADLNDDLTAKVPSAEDLRAPAPAFNLPALSQHEESQPAQTTLADVEAALYRAACQYQLDPQLLWAVAVTESGLRPNARSNAGAIGVMQLMPATAARYNVSNPYDPAQNIQAGARHLRYLIDYYNGDYIAALAAYNAGEGAVDAYRRGLPFWDETRRRWINPQGKVLPIPPYAETISYVQKIVRLWQYATQRDMRATRNRSGFVSLRQSMRSLDPDAQNHDQSDQADQSSQMNQITKSIPVPQNDVD